MFNCMCVMNMRNNEACDMCERFIFQSHDYFIIKNYRSKNIIKICLGCFGGTEFQNYAKFIYRGCLILPPIFADAVCHRCEVVKKCAKICFSGERGCRSFFICLACFTNKFHVFVRKIPEIHRTRELMESAFMKYRNCGQKYFELVSDHEKSKILNWRLIIKIKTRLPKDLLKIVLQYYWIFEW